MTFKYKLRGKGKTYIRIYKPRFATEAEQLTGLVNGIAAAMGEERFAKALRKNARYFWFRINPTNVPKGMPGWLELDFLVQTHRLDYRAFEIDGMSFVHRGQREAAESIAKDLRRLEGLALMGINLQQIEHVDEALLQTQDEANKAVRNLLL